MTFNLEFVRESFPTILSFLPATLGVAFSSELLALLVGLAFPVLKRKNIPVVRQILAVWASYCRAVPTLVQLLVAIQFLPKLVMLLNPNDLYGTSIPLVVYVVIALGFNHGSYASEIFRSAFDSVDIGQTEAALSTGMTRLQTMVKIVIPQALVVAIPNLGSLFISLIQETSLVTYVGVREIASVGINLADLGYYFLEAYIMLTVIYEACSFVFGRLLRVAERKIGRYKYQQFKFMRKAEVLPIIPAA
jgi:L-cystine transport system permease protein